MPGLITWIFWATFVSCTSLLSCSAENTGGCPEIKASNKEERLSNSRLKKNSSLESLLKDVLKMFLFYTCMTTEAVNHTASVTAKGEATPVEPL